MKGRIKRLEECGGVACPECGIDPSRPPTVTVLTPEDPEYYKEPPRIPCSACGVVQGERITLDISAPGSPWPEEEDIE